MTATPKDLHQFFVGKIRNVGIWVEGIALSQRADRSVFRAHGFIDSNWKSRAADYARETDHLEMRKEPATRVAN